MTALSPSIPAIDIPPTPGIYAIYCYGKAYVGRGVNMRRRCFGHICQLTNSRHCSTKMQEYHNKFGIGAFMFDVIERITAEPGEDLINKLSIREDYWIRRIKPWFNTQGGSIRSSAKTTDERDRAFYSIHSANIAEWLIDEATERRDGESGKGFGVGDLIAEIIAEHVGSRMAEGGGR
jgi:group I intron endonuclease